MRSVVVVLPASMCAMMPMLRIFARASATATSGYLISLSCRVRGPCPRCRSVTACRPGAGVLLSYPQTRLPTPALPPVVREGAVGLGHLVGVLAALDRRPQAVAGVQQLVHQPLHHRLLAALPGVLDQPAQPQGGGTGRPDLHRDLVGGATDPAAAHLQ